MKIFLVFLIFLFVNILSIDSAFTQLLHDKTLNKIVNKTSDPQNSKINVDTNPTGIATYFNPFNDINIIYVVNSDSDTVSVISVENNTKIKDIPVGPYPTGIAINRVPDTIYVPHYANDTVSVISVENNTKIKDIPVGEGPTGIAIKHIGSKPMAIEQFGSESNTKLVYVANRYNDTVSVISVENNTKIKDIPVGDEPIDIVVNSDTDKVYVANHGDGTVSVISGKNNTKIKDIDVGIGVGPTAIDFYQNTIYVANRYSHNVSVISGENNTKIKDIPVGKNPYDIAISPDTGKVYVTNYANTVSVISGENNTKIKDIDVGMFPRNIVIHENMVTVNEKTTNRNTVYVTNEGSSTVSVISGENNTKIKDIPVGKNPKDIAIDDITDTIYVSNSEDNTVSVIDAVSNKVVAGIEFRVFPFNSGYIECDQGELKAPLSEYFYVYEGTPCIAKPSKGFEFLSWEENLNDNSTQLLTISNPASTTIFDLIDGFIEDVGNFLGIWDFFGITNDIESESILNVTYFGTFTANFKELPPPIPSEYLIGLYTIVASTIIGWSIPSIIGWIKTRREITTMNYYHKKITSLYDDGIIKKTDIEQLDKLKRHISNGYAKGKVNNEHYTILKDEISVLYQKTLKNRIDALKNNLNLGDKEKQVEQIKDEVNDAYSNGKLTELHYSLLKEKISELNTDNRK